MGRNALAALLLLGLSLVLPPPRAATGNGPAPAPAPDPASVIVDGRSVLVWVDSFGTTTTRRTMAEVAARLRGRSSLTTALVPSLVPLLEDENEARRRGTAYLLAALGPAFAEPAVPGLAAQLEYDPDPVALAMLLSRFAGAREAMVKGLERRIIGPAPAGATGIGAHAVPPGSSREQRRSCLRYLVRAAPDAGRALLIRCLRSPEPWLRREAADRLGDVGPRAKDAVPALRACLGDGDAELRMRAAVALVMIKGTSDWSGGPRADGESSAVQAAIRRLFADRGGRQMGEIGAWLAVSAPRENDGVYVLTPVFPGQGTGIGKRERLAEKTERFCRYLCLRGIAAEMGAEPIVVQASADSGFECGTP